MKTNALVIMAAGFGSRYKGGIKQMDGVGPAGEWIMDYSIYDAYQVGIRKVVLIIREELRDLIESHFVNLPDDLELKLVYQKLTDLPEGYSFPNRVKPWGTGQAILCCEESIDEPFIVINSDDYYGKLSFEIMNDFLNNQKNEFGMVGYLLKNTLSENGSVNRGICSVDPNMNLINIEETYQIEKTTTGIKGVNTDDQEVQLESNDYCSLNFWGFTPSIFEELKIQFVDFLNHIEDSEKAEFLLPSIAKHMIKENNICFKVLPTNDEWFGMTYQEDKEQVQNKIENYIKKGLYPNPLWKR